MNQYKSFRALKGKISFLFDKKAIFVLISFLVITGVVFIVSTGLGDMRLSPLTVLSVLFGGGSDMEQLVVQSFRLPRIIVALMVGIALAVAGGILQGMIRNPLASPDILGITGGASVAVVSFLSFFSDTNNSLTVSIKWLPLAAFVGAGVIALLVYVLAWKNGVSPIRIVLIGIGISALMQALTTLMMIMGPIYRASQANIWITGSVYGSSWSNVAILVPWTIIFVTIAFIMVKNINILELGDDIATGVGGSIQRQRFFLLLVSTALVGGSVAFAGGIGFVGLMAPHMARRLVGSSFGALLPVSALIGGILVMLADLIGRTMFSPLEIPAGVFTAGIGAPYFIYLLFKTRNA
ncbi:MULTISPECIES: iron ABC transporter permease [Bacillaceae]|jgi:iron complex transport system permease protein|uniref:FecCD family ABC transporter permease n=1 Tax=Bacillaceae TaxID=186817 RepID=UPI0006AE9264|nr:MULTISPECIES: iron ABC transporter permease [Bacillaceae]ALC87471.1 iron ABC transporter permease [Bacillus sp. FJAT-22090]KQL34861.1 iron ABC transporter permease [Psychrobacillus sp. FJAT-21963]MDF2067298.1 iron ABC transporter permease [Bacillus sp. Cr_A10]